MVEVLKKPKNREEVAQAKKQAKSLLTVAAVLVGLTIIWVLITGNAPKLFVLGIGIFGALGVMQKLAADKAERALQGGSASAPESQPTDVPPQS